MAIPWHLTPRHLLIRLNYAICAFLSHHSLPLICTNVHALFFFFFFPSDFSRCRIISFSLLNCSSVMTFKNRRENLSRKRICFGEETQTTNCLTHARHNNFFLVEGMIFLLVGKLGKTSCAFVQVKCFRYENAQ